LPRKGEGEEEEPLKRRRNKRRKKKERSRNDTSRTRRGRFGIHTCGGKEGGREGGSGEWWWRDSTKYRNTASKKSMESSK
jgi:hypothetical protein